MNLLYFDSINSTNEYLKENQTTLDDFTFVSTSFQTNGKGREDRDWFSEKNKNLLFSFLIKDKSLIKKYKSLSIGSASLLARFLELEGLKDVKVKWPNDVYIKDKKIAGILLEGDINKYLVIGVGLNVNQDVFKGEYRVTPTSMKLELKKEFDLENLKTKLFQFLEKHIHKNEFEKKTIKFLSSHNYLLGKRVIINNINGIVTGIDNNFSIIVDGILQESGEIKIIK